MQTIKLCNYKDLRDIGMRWVCRCDECKELFLGIKSDWLCGCSLEKNRISSNL